MSKYTVGFLFAVAGPLLYRRAAVNAREHNFTLFDKSNILKTVAVHTDQSGKGHAYVTRQLRKCCFYESGSTKLALFPLF